MLRSVTIIEVFTYITEYSKLFSILLFPSRCEIPNGTPILAMVIKIPEKEITTEDLPIISGVTRLDNNSHNRYPESNPTIVSTYRYVAPLPNSIFLILLTVPL